MLILKTSIISEYLHKKTIFSLPNKYDQKSRGDPNSNSTVILSPQRTLTWYEPLQNHAEVKFNQMATQTITLIPKTQKIQSIEVKLCEIDSTWI